MSGRASHAGTMTDTETAGTFTTTGWDEQPYAEPEGGPKLARAHVTNTYEGVIAGEAVLEMLLFYEPKAADDESWGTGRFVAFEHVTGTVDGRTGSFVLREEGTFEGAEISASFTVEPGSPSGGLAGLTGAGTYGVKLGDPSASYTFDYAFGS